MARKAKAKAKAKVSTTTATTKTTTKTTTTPKKKSTPTKASRAAANTKSLFHYFSPTKPQSETRTRDRLGAGSSMNSNSSTSPAKRERARENNIDDASTTPSNSSLSFGQKKQHTISSPSSANASNSKRRASSKVAVKLQFAASTDSVRTPARNDADMNTSSRRNREPNSTVCKAPARNETRAIARPVIYLDSDSDSDSDFLPAFSPFHRSQNAPSTSARGTSEEKKSSSLAAAANANAGLKKSSSAKDEASNKTTNQMKPAIEGQSISKDYRMGLIRLKESSNTSSLLDLCNSLNSDPITQTIYPLFDGAILGRNELLCGSRKKRNKVILGIPSSERGVSKNRVQICKINPPQQPDRPVGRLTDKSGTSRLCQYLEDKRCTSSTVNIRCVPDAMNRIAILEPRVNDDYFSERSKGRRRGEPWMEVTHFLPVGNSITLYGTCVCVCVCVCVCAIGTQCHDMIY